MLSVIYGLISAVAWGAADFTGGLASRRTTYYQVVAVTWFLGIIVMPAAALLSNEPLMPLSGWLWCGAGGAFGVVGILILYKMMAEGVMSIAVSVSAVMAAVLPVLAGALLEGLPKTVRIAGFALALISVWLITAGDGSRGRIRFRDVALPLLAGVGFGMYFILVNRGSQDHVFWPMVATKVMGVIVLLALRFSGKKDWFPTKGAISLILLNFVLDNMGTVAYILAGQVGRLDIAAVLGSLYPGMTILLAWLLLKEKLRLVQWSGVALALCSIVLLSIE